jgi:leucine-rich repeat-containing protein 49
LAELPDGVKDSNNNNALMMSSKDVDLCASNNGVISSKVGTPSKGALLRQKSRNQLNLNFSANSNGGNSTNSTLAGNNVGGSVKPNGTITPTSFLQKSFMFQAAKSGLLKRANSVMINYSPTQTPTGAATGSNSTIFGALQRGKGKLVATPSFSVIDISTNHHHEMVNGIAMKASISPPEQTPPPLQIDANNSYMNSFRFNLTNLVFLDLYNNQIEKISNLDGLKSLTVLLLGKNRISDITGIISLKHTLRVLDLHGNRITHIAQKICQLQELKSLNLAGNLLRQIQSNDFAGLCCLKELNLKRNRIKKINVSDDLHNLER